MAEIVYPKLSYKIMGIIFKVYNELGGGYQEKVYQKVLKREFSYGKIGFLEQVKVDFNYKNMHIGRYYIDFIIDNKIVLEIKVTPKFTPRDIMQVLNYLKQSNLELGILISMNKNKVIYKRILKGRNYSGN